MCSAASLLTSHIEEATWRSPNDSAARTPGRRFGDRDVSRGRPARVTGETPALSQEQIRQFLLSAKIIKHKDLSKRVTPSRRLTLTEAS